MAHKICFVGGKAQSFTVGDKSWHGLEANLDRAPSFEDAMAKYGLDYPLEKLPYFRPGLADTSTGVALPTWVEAGDSFYVSRADTGKSLGAVGSNYEVITNREAFEAFKPLVDEGLLTLETGGVLRDGADAWMLGRWAFDKMGPVVQEVFGNEVIPFSAVMANHNGRRGVLLGLTPVRIVCANTLGAAEESGASRWESIPHIQGAKVKLVEAAERIFRGVVEKYEVVARQYRLLKATHLGEADFARMVLDAIAPDPRQSPKFNPEAKLANVVVERADRKREKIRSLWENGKGHTGERNAWFAYNAAVEAIDHCDDLWQRRDGSWQSRGLMATEWTRKKNAVLDNLVRHAHALAV